jgi:hypothetical protein
MRISVSKLPRPKIHPLLIVPQQSPVLYAKQLDAPDRHFLSKFSFLPLPDRQFLAKVWCISGIYDDDDECINCVEHVPSVSSNRIQVRQSPYLDTFYGHVPVRLTIDSGATGNMIRTSTVTRGLFNRASTRDCSRALASERQCSL